MTAATTEPTVPPRERARERGRGFWSMVLFIATEAMLFALTFFAYFYLAASKPQWPLAENPAYWRALVILGLLALGSGLALACRRGIERNQSGQMLAGLVATAIAGGLALYVSYFEYAERLKTLTPSENAYGSIYYTILTLHMAHLILGVLMFLYIFVRGLARHFSAEHHLAVTNGAMYWHFVTLTWLATVLVLYASPYLRGGGS